MRRATRSSPAGSRVREAEVEYGAVVVCCGSLDACRRRLHCCRRQAEIAHHTHLHAMPLQHRTLLWMSGRRGGGGPVGASSSSSVRKGSTELNVCGGLLMLPSASPSPSSLLTQHWPPAAQQPPSRLPPSSPPSPASPQPAHLQQVRQLVLRQRHQRGHLLPRPPVVVDGEGVHRHTGHAQLHRRGRGHISMGGYPPIGALGGTPRPTRPGHVQTSRTPDHAPAT